MSSATTDRSPRHKTGQHKLNRNVLLGLCLLALTPLLFYGGLVLFFRH